MYCHNCGQYHDETDRFCRFCGTSLNTPPAPPKGSLWVPVLIMTLLFAVGLCLFFTIPYSNDSPAADHNHFRAENGVLYFDASAYSGGSELVVPATVNGQQITALADGCFENCTTLTSIVLPDSLQIVGAHAFRGCTALRGIEIPDSVTRIGIEAFYGCTALEAVCLSDSVTYIGPGTFGECNQLHYIMFLGSHQDWIELYDEFITPYTGVFCDEGSFYQGKPTE